MLTWGVKRSFFLALEVKLGLGGTSSFLPGLKGSPGEALCFIPWAVLTNCVNQACTGPASKSSSSGDVAGAPVACTPLTGAPNDFQLRSFPCIGDITGQELMLFGGQICGFGQAGIFHQFLFELAWHWGIVHRGVHHLLLYGATEAPCLTHATLIPSVEFRPEGSACLSHHAGALSFNRMRGFGHGA